MKASLETGYEHQLIPGYHLLSLAEQSYFEQNTQAGRTFKKIVEELNAYQASINPLYLAKLFVLTLLPSYTAPSFETRLNEAKTSFQEHHFNDPALEAINYRIQSAVFIKYIPHLFNFLSEEEQTLLLNTEFAQEFIRIVIFLPNKQELSNALLVFKHELENSPFYPQWSKSIRNKKEALSPQYGDWLTVQFKHLSQFFPLLNYRMPGHKNSIITQLRKRTLVKDEFQSNIQTEFQKLFFIILNKANSFLPFLDLKSFNQQFAAKQAAFIFEQFSQGKPFPETLFLDYEKALYAELKSYLTTINNHNWTSQTIAIIDEAFSFIYRNLLDNTLVGDLTQVLDKLAESNSFMQSFTFTSQNDNYLNNWLDTWFLLRNSKQVAEAKSLFSSLTQPFIPLYKEYEAILKYEKNTFWKIYRLLMPFLILVTVLTLFSLVLGLAALPELIVAVALIPAFIVGLTIASFYVQAKDYLYHNLRAYYYGYPNWDPYAIPEFQTNARMHTDFKSNVLAEEIRRFYINALQKCDALEKAYEKQVILTLEDQKCREENRQRKLLMGLEWYDIHSNERLSSDEITSIVLSRLQNAGDQKHQELRMIFSSEAREIETSVSLLSQEIQKNLDAHATPPKISKQGRTQRIHLKFGLQFFKEPKCLAVKEDLEAIDNLMMNIPKAF